MDAAERPRVAEPPGLLASREDGLPILDGEIDRQRDSSVSDRACGMEEWLQEQGVSKEQSAMYNPPEGWMPLTVSNPRILDPFKLKSIGSTNFRGFWEPPD